MDNQKLSQHYSDIPVDYYEDGISHNLLQKFWHGRKFLAIEEMVRGINGKVLDLGCHSGFLTNQLQQITKSKEVFGVDISVKAIQYARQKYPNINFQVIDLNQAFPEFDGKFNLITCFDVLEHLLEPKKFIKEVNSHLLTGGYFIIGVPHENFLWRTIWWLWTHLGPGKVWQETHLHKFTLSTLEQMLRESGFQRAESKKIHLGIYYLGKYKKN